jgi:RNA polymerase sigma-70 factor (ECF subfamily)
LPGEHAQLLHLSFFEEHPHSRIAAEFDIPLGTVKTRIRSAMSRLRQLVDELES